MWSSLLIGNKDMSIKYTIKEYSENKVKVEWIADYLFSASRRKVRNVIIANMEIENNRYDIYANLVQLISTTGQSRDVYHLNRLSIQGVKVQP